MEVIGIRRDGVILRHVRVVAFFGRSHTDGPADPGGFFEGFRSPGARIQVSGIPVGFHQVHRNHQELEAGSSLKEQHGIIVGNRQQFANQTFAFFYYGGKLFAAMGYFRDRQTRTFEVCHGGGHLLEHFVGQYGRPGAEVDLSHYA